MFYTGVVGLMITAIPAIWVWKPVGINDLILLFVMGTLGAMAHNCFIRAYAQGEASVITPVDYTRLIMAALPDISCFPMCRMPTPLSARRLLSAPAFI